MAWRAGPNLAGQKELSGSSKQIQEKKLSWDGAFFTR
jgi:hypothetical protein